MHGNCGQQMQFCGGHSRGHILGRLPYRNLTLRTLLIPGGLSITGRCLRRLMGRQLAFGAYRSRLSPLERFRNLYDFSHRTFEIRQFVPCTAYTVLGTPLPAGKPCFSFNARRFADVLGNGGMLDARPNPN